MTQDEIKTILDAHGKWIRREAGGKRANLSGANLSGADLSRADLSGANLSRADLSGANLSRADLYGANLSRADLYGANLSRADLYGANLYGADLSRADLSGANLSRADLYGAYLYNVKHSGGDTITGNAGGYWWCAFRSDSGVFLAYGCEHHPIAWWREQTSALSVKHGESADHWRTVEAVINLAATLESTDKGEE